VLKDKIVIGILVGLLADAVKLTFNFISFKLDFTPVVFWQLVAGAVLEMEDVFTPVGILIGGIADIIMTMLFGVIFIYIIYLTGRENLWIKGIGFGMLVWVSFFVIVSGVLLRGKILPLPSGILVTIVAHFLYGLSLAVFTKFLAGDFTLFTEDIKRIQQVKSYKLLTPISARKADKGFKKPKKI
jgi:hypothetical protein